MVAKKEDRIKEIFAKLERFQKNLKMLNSCSAQLDQIFSKGKNTGNCLGLGYKGEYSNSKIVFVNANSMVNSTAILPISKERKFVTSSVTTENKTETIET